MISVVIPVAREERKRNLEMVLQLLYHQHFKNFEVILVEQVFQDQQDGISRRFYDSLQVDEYVSVVNPFNDLFCRSWLLNIGANRASGDRILFIDADVVFDYNYMESVAIQPFPWFIAWNRVSYMTKEQSDSFIANGFSLEHNRENLQISGGYMGPDLYCDCGKSTAFDTDFFFQAVGGYNENFMGWGGEDNDLAMRSIQFTNKKYLVMKRDLMHLNHKNVGGTASKQNQGLWWKTQHHPNEITRRILANQRGSLVAPSLVPVKDLVP